MSEVLNLITKDTTKEELLKEYESYPPVMPDGLENYPFAKGRVEPIFYEIKDGSTILDLGCNDGAFMQVLRDKKGCKVFGVDVSETALAVAEKRGFVRADKTTDGESITGASGLIYKADGEKLPFPDCSFDYVCLMEVLSHVHNPSNVLKEVRRVLKKNGVLLGSCPHANLELNIWDDKRKHHRYYRETELEKELNAHFSKTHLRVLKGGQFALSFATTHLGSEPVEMLFKCGGKKTGRWDEAQDDKSVLRVYMGFTQPGGVVYYRMRGFAEKMRQTGFEVAYEDFTYGPDDSHTKWQSRILVRDSLGKVWVNPDTGRPSLTITGRQLENLLNVADMSIWQIVSTREALALLETAKAALKRPVITESDDWMFDLPSYNLAAGPYQPNSDSEWLAHRQLEISDAFITSTQFIADNFKEMFPGKPVYVIPNALDFDVWDNVSIPKNLTEQEMAQIQKKEGMIRIGYTGCANHNRDMDVMIKPLLKILEENKNVEFVYAHPLDSLDKLKHPRVRCINRWVPIDYYPNELSAWGVDIGVAPLRDNKFNRAKSNLRWLEFSALKIPTVVSNVYPFKHSVRHEQDGLICSSELDWYESLKRLVTDAGERVALGNRAYERVKADFNMAIVAKKYAEVLKEIKCNVPLLKTK